MGRLAPAGTRRGSALRGLVDRQQAEQNAAYRTWIARMEEQASAPPADPATGPLISVIVPAFNTPDRYLGAMVDSVLRQGYQRWELCLVDGSTDAGRSEAIRAQASRDERVRLVALSENRGIAGNTNAGIDTARGDYHAFLDHDDTLAPFALNEVAAALRSNPGIDLFYSDEDKLSDDGRRRSQPFFKPGWSPDLFLCANYLAHFVVARAGLVRSLAGLRTGFDGAQDYDFLLRALGRDPVIHHVPRVSYHWRMAGGSNAGDPSTKPYAQESGSRALTEHFSRNGVAARVEPVSSDSTAYRVHYALGRLGDVHVVAAGSDRVVAALREVTQGPRLRPLPGSDALATLPEDDLVLIVEVPGQPGDPGWLQDLAGTAAQPGVGVVAPALSDPRGRSGGMGYAAAERRLWPQLSGLPEDRWTPAGWPGWPRDVVAVGGCGILTVGLARELVRAGTPLGLVPLSLAAHRLGRRNVSWAFSAFKTGASLAPVMLEEAVEDPYRNPNLLPGGLLAVPARTP